MLITMAVFKAIESKTVLCLNKNNVRFIKQQNSFVSPSNKASHKRTGKIIYHILFTNHMSSVIKYVLFLDSV